MRLLQVICLFLALVGCASSPRQYRSALQNERGLPQAHAVPDVPFIEQAKGHCGPATLSMAIGWSGKMVSVDDLAEQAFTPGMKGSLQADMISASRRNGMLAIPIKGFDALLAEIAHGHPVIVFENLALSWWPQWHYALVFGYDLEKQTVTMHSGPDAFKTEDLKVFENSWELGDYWGLVVLPPNRLSATADELTHGKAAAALEQLGRIHEAGQTYQQMLLRWPRSLVAKIGAANVAYAQSDHELAIELLTEAVNEHPSSTAARHNLLIARKSWNASNTKTIETSKQELTRKGMKNGNQDEAK